MGMSTHVQGFRSTDDPTYKKHAAVLRACLDAGIKELPAETTVYFGSKWPEESMFDDALEVKLPTTSWKDDCRDGFEIEVAKIPQGVFKIRFYNSY